jgi:nitrogen fixation NifU-like protein
VWGRRRRPDQIGGTVERYEQEHLTAALSAIPPARRFWQHAKQPHNIGFRADSNATATGVGSCGDKVSIGLRVTGNTIEEVTCAPEGCVYTTACASAMSVLAKGCTLDEALRLQPEDVVGELEGLPEDHLHCARLAVNTLGEAIADYYRRAVLADRSSADKKV